MACALVVSWFFVKERTGSDDSGSATSFARLETVLEGSDWEREFNAGRVIGDPSNPVRVLVFEDFECPACRYFEDAVVKTLRAAQPTAFTVAVRHWPLDGHRMAMPAAVAAECADEQSRFWDFHSVVFANQDSLKTVSMMRLADEAGVADTSRFRICVSAPSSRSRVVRDAEVAKAIGGRGTPLILVNGRLLPGVPDSAQFRVLIGEALAATQK